MTFGDDLAWALEFLRGQAETRMTETVTAGTFTDSTDPETGDLVRTPATTRYEGVGRIRYPSVTVSDREGAGQVSQEQQVILSVPSGSPRLYEGDEVVVDASTADALLVGRVYQIAGSAQAGQTTAHRYPLTELS